MNSSSSTYFPEVGASSLSADPRTSPSQHQQTARVIPLPGAALQPVQQMRRVGRLPRMVSHIRDARDKRNHQIRQDIEAVRAVMRTSNDAHCKVFSTGMARLKELGAPPQAFLIYSEF